MIDAIFTCILSGIAFALGLATGIGSLFLDKPKNKIDPQRQKVLLIKPSKYTSTDREQEIKEEVKVSGNGVVFIPSDCEYEFGEINRIMIKHR